MREKRRGEGEGRREERKSAGGIQNTAYGVSVMVWSTPCHTDSGHTVPMITICFLRQDFDPSQAG